MRCGFIMNPFEYCHNLIQSLILGNELAEVLIMIILPAALATPEGFPNKELLCVLVLTSFC